MILERAEEQDRNEGSVAFAVRIVSALGRP